MIRNVKCTGLIFIILTAFLYSCKKVEIPTISTSSLTNITSTSAVGGGHITSDGNSDITYRGVCWSLEANPTTKDSKTDDGDGTGQFVSNITGLNAGTTYHVRACASNSVGTAYGADLSFTTLGNVPECITQPASNISPTGVTLNGTINANHATANVAFEYGPTIEYGQTISAVQSPVSGNSITNVYVSITGLSEGTSYHFRVKAVNSIGSDEGEDMTFTTSGQAPEATTQSPTNVNTVTATLNGSVNANHSSTVVTFEYGPTNAYGSTVTAAPSPVTGNASTVVSADVTGLNPGMVYHFRIKAVSSLGTDFGDDVTFTTVGQVPIAITQQASNVQVTTATMNGTVNANHLPTVFSFEYGLTSRYGNTASPASNQVTGSANVGVSINLVGLTGGTIYHYRIVATNQLGTTYGEDVAFTTGSIISLSTNPIIEVAYNSAVGGGNITNDGGYAITARGVCWSKVQNPTIGDDHTIDGSGIGTFTSQMKCLDEQSTYYVRSYATNIERTVYGDQRSFTTGPCPIAFNPDLTYGTVTDIDGNCYKTIQIGDQTWMAENLKTTRYNDGSIIPNLTDAYQWVVITNEAYCWYLNDQNTYMNTYGALYNWYAVNNGSLCPEGWHVSSNEEWSVLLEYLGGADIAGGKLMETGINHWESTLSEITNETGFTALPGGYRSGEPYSPYSPHAEFGYERIFGYWWTSTGYSLSTAFSRSIVAGYISVRTHSNLSLRWGFSVRCVKDN